MVVDSNSTMERIMSPCASGCDLQEGRLAEQRPLKGIDWEGSTAALPKYFCWWSHMCFPFWARNCPWGWELISWVESLLATCSPTARASAVHWRGNEERQWVRQLVFFNIKRKGERLLILPCMRNWYWTWKPGKLGYCFCCYTPGSKHNHICSWLSLQHNRGGRKFGGGEKKMGVRLSEERCFTRFPTLFLPPHSGDFVSLLMANAKSRVCVFKPSEKGKVSGELLKIIKD